jgi:PAS domain S-box-containing protein
MSLVLFGAILLRLIAAVWLWVQWRRIRDRRLLVLAAVILGLVLVLVEPVVTSARQISDGPSLAAGDLGRLPDLLVSFLILWFVGLLGRSPTLLRSAAEQPSESSQAVEIDPRLRNHAFNSSTSGIVIVDATDQELPIIYCNPAFERLTGYSQQEVLGRNCRFLQGDDRDQPGLKSIRQAIEEDREVTATLRNYRKDGSMFWCELHISPVRDVEGRVTHCLGFQYDITERREAEQALRESEALYADLYENAPDMMASVDARSSRIVHCNQAMATVLGYAKEQIIGRSAFDVLSSESAEIVRARIFPELVASGRVSNEELSLVCADGSTRDVILNSTAVQDDDGTTLYSRSVLRDVTEQRRAEQRLAESEARLRAIFDAEPECVKLVNAEGELLDMNPAGLAMIEADSLEQVVNQEIYPLISPEHREAFRAMHASVMRGTPQRLEFEIIGLAGTCRWMDTHATPMRDSSGKVTALLSVTRDITDKKQAAEALRESEELFRRLVETAPFGVRRNDLEGRIIFANKALGTILACEPQQMIGKYIWDFAVNDDDRGKMEQHFQRHLLDPQPDSASFEAKRRTLDGRIIDVTIDWTYDRDRDGKTIGMIVVVTDITARKQSDQDHRLHRDALAHMTRLSTMGELIAGLAHEVKQPLYAIANFATATSVALSNVQHGFPIDGEWLQEMKAWNNGVQDASKRANEIIQRLREFARKGKGKREKTSVGRLIHDSVELVAFEARQSNTVVQTELDDGLADVVVDRIQCEQVLVNLLHNSYEALADFDGQRRVIIRATPSDEFVEIQIADNGPGLPTDQNGKLFEAFYTTKPSSMGMGLAISQTIVEDHGGRLWGRANQCGGATFHFTLPAEVKQEHLQLKNA